MFAHGLLHECRNWSTFTHRNVAGMFNSHSSVTFGPPIGWCGSARLPERQRRCGYRVFAAEMRPFALPSVGL